RLTGDAHGAPEAATNTTWRVRCRGNRMGKIGPGDRGCIWTYSSAEIVTAYSNTRDYIDFRREMLDNEALPRRYRVQHHIRGICHTISGRPYESSHPLDRLTFSRGNGKRKRTVYGYRRAPYSLTADKERASDGKNTRRDASIEHVFFPE